MAADLVDVAIPMLMIMSRHRAPIKRIFFMSKVIVPLCNMTDFCLTYAFLRIITHEPSTHLILCYFCFPGYIHI